MPAPAPAAVRGTIHDNPWAGVEPLHSNGNNGESTSPNNQQNQQQRRVLHEGFWLQMLDIVIQLLLCLDACAGMFWFIFGAILHHKHEESSLAAYVMIFLGVLLLLRAALVSGGLWISTDSVCSCERAGLAAAGYVSLGLAVSLAVASLGGLIFAKHVQMFAQSHSLDLTHNQVQWLLERYVWVLGFMGLGATVEGLKWPMYGLYHRSLLLWEEEQERLENQNLIRREAATGRPWWWSSTYSRHGRQRQRAGNAHLTQALLADENNENNTHSGAGGTDGARASSSGRRRRRGFFSWFGRSTAETTLRDDGSVDFASVQEEWASRAEEDPVWWSREDDDDADNLNNISRVTTDVDTSWAHDISQV